MAVRARMADGINLVLNIDLDQFTKDYQEALRKNRLLEVENGSGRMRVINPRQILYFEDASSPVDEGDPTAVPWEGQNRDDLRTPH